MTHPTIKDAPGHIWRKHTRGWECRWQCRTDLAERGFSPKSQQLFVGDEPTETEIAYIKDNCRKPADLEWGMMKMAKGTTVWRTRFEPLPDITAYELALDRKYINQSEVLLRHCCDGLGTTLRHRVVDERNGERMDVVWSREQS